MSRWVVPARELCVVFCGLVFASASALPLNCDQQLVSFKAPCVSNVNCTVSNQTCACLPGFSGVGLWFDLSGSDCNFNDLAFQILNYIAYVVMIIMSLAIMYRLSSFGRLRIFSCLAKGGGPGQDVVIPTQITLLLMLITILFGVAQYSLFCFGNLYPHSSWGSAMTFLGFHVFLYAYTGYRGTTIVLTATALVKQIRSDAEQIGFKIRMLGSLLNLSVGIGHVVCLFALVAVPQQELKYRFFMAYFAISIVYQVCWLAAVMKYYTAFITTMRDHLEKAVKLGANQANNESLVESLAKLTRLRAIFAAAVGMHVILSIICMILPEIGTYYIPIWQITGCFAALSYIRELRPAVDTKHTASSQTRGTASTQSGHSAHSAHSANASTS